MRAALGQLVRRIGQVVTLKVVVDGEERLTVAEGDGPIHALDAALRKALIEFYPETARVIHSSQLESSDTLALRSSAHAVLAKPASESAISAAIELALRVASQQSLARSG